MPEADTFEAPQGSTFFGRYLESITEAFVGNGITNDGDAEVTADPNVDMEIAVAAATELAYGGQTYNLSGDTFTLSDGPTTTTNGEPDRRVDMVAFDSTANSGSGGYVVSEGSAGPNPEPPATPADGILLALVTIPNGATNIQDGNVLNWRAHPAASSLLSEGFEATASTTQFGPLFNIPVESSTAQGTEVSYTFTIDGESFAYFYAESDGSGGIQNGVLNFPKPINSFGGLEVSGPTASINTDIELNGDISTTGSIIPSGGPAIQSTDTFIGAPVVNIDTTSNASQGDNVGYAFGIDNQYFLEFEATADGSGGITDKRMVLNNSIPFQPPRNLADTSVPIVDDAVDTDNVSDGDLLGYAFDAAGYNVIRIAVEVDGSGSPKTPADDFTSSAVHFGVPSVFDYGIQANAPSVINAPLDVNAPVDTSQPITPASSVAGFESETNANGIKIGNIPLDDTESAGTFHSANILDVSGMPLLSATFTNDGNGNLSTPNLAVLLDGSDPQSQVPIFTQGAIPRNSLSSTSVRISGDLSKNISDATQHSVVVDSIADGETIEVDKASLTTTLAAASSSGIALELVTFDGSGGYTTQSTIVSGDGATVHDGVTGSPLASYTNSSGAEQSVGVIVDNASGSAEYVFANVEGQIIVPLGP